ncbi:MAG TPA: ComF family protein [Nevskiales bacterium]|nr:ComF family protein [Nevskiales bacterium]
MVSPYPASCQLARKPNLDIWLKIRHTPDILADLVYPRECVLCGGRGHAGLDLCPGCRAELPWNRHACPRCALPLPTACPAGTVCADCLPQPPPYARAWSAYVYTGPLRWLHRRLKFGARLANRRLLAALLAEALEQALARGELPRPDVLVVMPLHPRRLMWRGFNQSLELLRPAARRLGLEPDCSSLRRVKATRPQSDLPAGARRRNVRGAFACDRPLTGQHVALFDDVVTTGHTVAEAARVLRRAGAREISVWCLARTEKT